MRFFCAAWAATALIGCAPASEKPDPRLVMATIRPYALIAAEIAGGRLRVETLLPPSASPHTWSPSPGELRRAAAAGLIIANGLGLEAKLSSFLERYRERTILAASVLEPGGEGILPNGRGHRHDGESGADPHLWADPSLMISFAGLLAERFAMLDPEGADEFKENSAKFSNELKHLDEGIREEAEGYRSCSIITFHDAFIRFFDRYGVTRIAVIMPVPGSEPSASRLMELGALIREHSVRALYGEPQFNTKGIRLLAGEYGLPVYMLAPLGEDAGITNYSSFLSFNWGEIKKGFAR